MTIEDVFGEPTKTSKPPLTEEQYQGLIDALTQADLHRIDEALMASASTQFRKVARVVGTAMAGNEDRIPDYFYAARVRRLVDEGRLLSRGDLAFMGLSEVQLPD